MKNAEKIVEAYERREEIHVGRPLAWAFQLGLAALVVTAFWLLFRGADLDTVLIRSAAALFAFAAAGYAAGRLLEKPPEVDPSIFAAPPDSGSMRPSKRSLPLDAVRPGMILAEPARQADGEVLIQSDTVLTEELLDVMREYEIPSAVVKLAEGGEEHHAQENDESETAPARGERT